MMRARWFVALLMIIVGIGAADPSLARAHTYHYDFSRDDATSGEEAVEGTAAELGERRSPSLSVGDWGSYDDIANLERASAGSDGYGSAPRAAPGTAIEPLWAQAPNRGFLAGWSRTETLRSGTRIDRYGNDAGRFFSPAGTPLEARALPTGSGPLRTYEVLRPFDVQGGVVAPAFGQPGLGIQYMSPRTVADLIEAGFLKAVG